MFLYNIIQYTTSLKKILTNFLFNMRQKIFFLNHYNTNFEK